MKQICLYQSSSQPLPSGVQMSIWLDLLERSGKKVIRIITVQTTINQQNKYKINFFFCFVLKRKLRIKILSSKCNSNLVSSQPINETVSMSFRLWLFFPIDFSFSCFGFFFVLFIRLFLFPIYQPPKKSTHTHSLSQCLFIVLLCPMLLMFTFQIYTFFISKFVEQQYQLFILSDPMIVEMTS